MAWIELKLHPKLVVRLARALERIAAGIDRAYPPPPDEKLLRRIKPFGGDELVTFDPEAEYERELEEEARQFTK